MKRAVFIGWQEDIAPFPPLALFNVITEDMKYPHGTTVDQTTLVEWGIEIPEFLGFDDWKMLNPKGAHHGNGVAQ